VDEPRLTQPLADEVVRALRRVGPLATLLYPSLRRWLRLAVRLIEAGRPDLPKE
jgi:hypothetical protein